MDDFAVARADPLPDGGLGFHDDGFAPALGQLARDREANRAGTDDDRVNLVHGRPRSDELSRREGQGDSGR